MRARRRDLLPPQEPEDFGVLVPGLFGIGFLISLIVLASDAIAHLFPTSGRRRRAALAQIARGRADELHSLRTGEPPRPGRIDCVVRSRPTSLALALVAALLAVAAVSIGLALAAEIGEERKLWAAAIGVGIAVPLALLAAVWLPAAVFGSRAPRWLVALHTVWPIGTYPELALGYEEGWR